MYVPLKLIHTVKLYLEFGIIDNFILRNRRDIYTHYTKQSKLFVRCQYVGNIIKIITIIGKCYYRLQYRYFVRWLENLKKAIRVVKVIYFYFLLLLLTVQLQ